MTTVTAPPPQAALVAQAADLMYKLHTEAKAIIRQHPELDSRARRAIAIVARGDVAFDARWLHIPDQGLGGSYVLQVARVKATHSKSLEAYTITRHCYADDWVEYGCNCPDATGTHADGHWVRGQAPYIPEPGCGSMCKHVIAYQLACAASERRSS